MLVLAGTILALLGACLILAGTHEKKPAKKEKEPKDEQPEE